MSAAPPGGMPFDGTRPIAIVTGGARRVGRAIVERLCEEGCDVLLTYNTSDREAHELAGALREKGRHVRAEKLELSADPGPAAERWGRSLPRIDVLVHSASTYRPSPLDGTLAGATLDALRVNALAPLAITQRLIPRLRASALPGGGSIVAMLDIHAIGRPRRGFLAYDISKAALHEVVRGLALELAPEIRVNGVAPGVVAWPELGHESHGDAQTKYLRRVPLARAGTPEDAAEGVAWLALRATYTTGEVIRVDGGRWIT